MRVENISLIQNRRFAPAPQLKSTEDGKTSPAIETSVYKQNGVTIPFGVWMKGANEAEEACIKMFRRVRENRCRKYSEPQIAGFMNELRGAQPGNKIEDIVKEFFMTYKICHNEFGAELANPVPDARLVRNYMRVAKNCNDEYERLGLIGFTQHELCVGAAKPLEALSNAAPEQQSRFIKIMNDISFDTGGTEHAEGLYDDLRHVIYAAEDLPKLDEAGKVQYLSDVHADYKRLKTEESFKTPSDKERAVKIARDIVDAMMDVLKI